MENKNNFKLDHQPELILASESPRRSELLRKAGVSFKTISAGIEEIQQTDESPKAFAMRTALEKARAITYEIAATPKSVYILGADTIVVLNNEIFGKPYHDNIAKLHLEVLSGNTHEVITGYAIIRAPNELIVNEACVSKVTMHPLSQKQIETYVATGEPLDKAGSYAIQGIGKKLIQQVEGSVNNVIGLPVEDILPWFKKVGL
jgi:septum formation protein